MSKLSDATTGEVPLLFVFEVDPMITEDENDEIISSNDSGSISSSPTKVISEKDPNVGIRYSYLAVCQRKVELSNVPMFHPWYQRVFGTPFILRVADLEGYTGRDLYDLVAKRVERYVPESVLTFISRENTGHKGLMSETTNNIGNGKLRSGRRQRFNQTKSDAEDTAFENMPRYGFRLRVTSRDGKCCELCPWYDCCTGCLITDDDYPTIAMCGDTIAIDWHLAVEVATDSFDMLSSAAEPRANMLTNVKKHKSSHSGKNKYGRASISLDDCLDAFTKEERMPDVSTTMSRIVLYS